MELEEAKDNLLKQVNTPDGIMILYGINCTPNHQGFGLIFYKETKQVIFWNIDCSVLELSDISIGDDPESFEENQKFIDSGQKVAITYLFPNGMVATCGHDNQQIGMLQGSYTKELHEKIKKYSDERTIWRGF